MQNVTTISEIASIRKVSISLIRYRLAKNKVKPVGKAMWNHNGHVGQLYKIDEMEKVLADKPITKNESKQNTHIPIEPSIQKRKLYSNEFVCRVLRPHIKHYLNNKLIRDWNYLDWTEFNKLIE